MSTTLAVSALLLGLAGGPHCAAMCGPACGALATRPAVARPVALPGARCVDARRMLAFHGGRLASYSLAGAAAAAAMQNLASLASATAALRPAWVLFHLVVLGWGLALLATARQPAWAGGASRSLWQRLQPLVQRPRAVGGAGLLWAFVPCGLLHSALLVAALSGGPLHGALSMALFAAGSAVSLWLAPVLLLRLRAGNRFRQAAGTRAAGALLALAALWALGIDVFHRVAAWCGLA